MATDDFAGKGFVHRSPSSDPSLNAKANRLMTNGERDADVIPLLDTAFAHKWRSHPNGAPTNALI